MDERDEERLPVRDGVDLIMEGVTTRGTLRNLSPSGCMIECSASGAEIGTPVTVRLKPYHTAQGEIAWQLGESIGIFFLEPIPAKVVRHFALDDWALRADWALQTTRIPQND